MRSIYQVLYAYTCGSNASIYFTVFEELHAVNRDRVGQTPSGAAPHCPAQGAVRLRGTWGQLSGDTSNKVDPVYAVDCVTVLIAVRVNSILTV